MTPEGKVEKHLVDAINSIGGLCLKFRSPSSRGVPDRIVMYDGNICFVELKAPGESPRKSQLSMIRKMDEQKIPVYVADSPEDIDNFIKDVLQVDHFKIEKEKNEMTILKNAFFKDGEDMI